MHNLARNRKSTLHNLRRRTSHNLVENPEALGFHQEQTETMEDSTDFILFTRHISFKIFQSQKKKKKREKKFLLQVSVIIQNSKSKSLF